MKALAWIAAALIATTGVAGAAAPAAAERVRVVERNHYEHSERHWDRGRHGGASKKWRWRTVCHTQWRNHHRERVCRRIRYR